MAGLGERRARQGPLNAVPVAVFLLLGFAAPLLAVIIFSFMPERTFSLWQAPGLGNYATIFTGTSYLSLLWSLGLAAVTVLLLAVICYPIAYGLTRVFGRWSTLLTLLFTIPLFVSENARDPWLPDAVAIATASAGAEFARDLATRRIASPDTMVHHGIRRAVQTLARKHGTAADAAVAVMLIQAVPQANPIVAVGVLDGLAQGWPEERPPQLTDEQRSALRTAAANAPAAVAAAFGRLAARWTLPNVFTTP